MQEFICLVFNGCHDFWVTMAGGKNGDAGLLGTLELARMRIQKLHPIDDI